jgi:hypothetical protein
MHGTLRQQHPDKEEEAYSMMMQRLMKTRTQFYWLRAEGLGFGL